MSAFDLPLLQTLPPLAPVRMAQRLSNSSSLALLSSPPTFAFELPLPEITQKWDIKLPAAAAAADAAQQAAAAAATLLLLVGKLLFPID